MNIRNIQTSELVNDLNRLFSYSEESIISSMIDDIIIELCRRNIDPFEYIPE